MSINTVHKHREKGRGALQDLAADAENWKVRLQKLGFDEDGEAPRKQDFRD
jgi:hypothetical protein